LPISIFAGLEEYKTKLKEKEEVPAPEISKQLNFTEQIVRYW